MRRNKFHDTSRWKKFSTVLRHIVGPCIATTEQIAILYSSISFHVVCSPHTMVTSKMNRKNPLQKEAEAASIDSVMAEDHAVLLKSVKKSKLKAAFFKWLFTKSDPNLTGISQRLFCAHPAASKKSVAAKSSSDDENVPARTRKVTADFLPRAFQKVTDDRKLCEY